jgi:hypothetical protein
MSLYVRSLFVGALLFGVPLTAAAQSGGPPPGGPPPGGFRPPQVAIDACSSRAEGDACSVTFGDHTIDGTCRKSPSGEGPLACAPNGPPPCAPPRQ